ncbi:flagellin biosynthesis protein FlgD [Pseudalgibacter alginicilyticus]|uniref:Flagellin biosynthesis protein FlgD n=1 Tax=Pseudalgibacter alginicilyticus TaxID=1736674 RepID=A0A0P0CMI1_9FLAO|nr:DUF2271 domain-containing protein [Pseudalgibacter alginicilyticus]ALJ05725.1 flagellin biosynthesis protein FlgD [Pseudalgibacter alginicilyticus]
MKTVLKQTKYSFIIVISLMATLAFTPKPNAYKCMVQMINYSGEGAYVVISLINPDGEYEKTLYVQGDDDEWYHDLSEWWHFYGKKRENIDAITGATIGGGERSISIIEIENDKVDAGYSLRFETAVEDKEYYINDVEFPLTSENVKLKHEGKGYIRYVRMIAQ